MEKGRIQLRNSFSLFYRPSLDRLLSGNGRHIQRHRIDILKKNMSLLAIAPSLRFHNSTEISKLLQLCSEAGLPVLRLSVASLSVLDFNYYRKTNDILQTRLQTGNVLLLYSADDAGTIRRFLPTVLIPTTTIVPERITELVAGQKATTDITETVRDYAQTIHPYLPRPEQQTQENLWVNPFRHFSIRKKLLTITSGLLLILGVAISVFASRSLQIWLTQLSYQYNQAVCSIIADELDSQQITASTKTPPTAVANSLTQWKHRLLYRSSIVLLNNKGSIISINDDDNFTSLSKNQLQAQLAPAIALIVTSPTPANTSRIMIEDQEYLAAFQILQNGFIVIVASPSDKVFESLYRFNQYAGLFIAITFIVGFLIIYFFSKNIVSSIQVSQNQPNHEGNEKT